MFCNNCGSKINDDAKFCINCGATVNSAPTGPVNQPESKSSTSNYYQPTPPTSNYYQPTPPVQQPYMQPPQNANGTGNNAKPDDQNTIALVGFILSFFFSIPALICSAIGLKNANNNGGVKRGFAKAGLIISIISIVVTVITTMIVIIVTSSALATLWHNGVYQDFDDAIRMVICSVA